VRNSPVCAETSLMLALEGNNPTPLDAGFPGVV
jgi:hypothetical protein